MKIQKQAILASIIIVILLACLALFFFWIEETIPQDIDNQQIVDIITDDEIEEVYEDQLYLSIMSHMESGFTDDKLEGVFLSHVEQIRYGISLADEVGAKLNIESEKPFALANKIWDLPILREIISSGHGAQTHCDIGGGSSGIKIPAEKYSLAFKANKTLVDNIIGAKNNLGCSGGGSMSDWATAASLAGFKYLNGIVGAHMLAVPLENRPGEEWTNEYIYNVVWHKNLPLDLYESIYPIPLADSQDIEADEDPIIIMMPGAIGRLDFASEDEDAACRKTHDCDLIAEDVDIIIAIIKDVADHYDPERGVAKMTVYLPINLYIEKNEIVLKYFFSELGKLEADGVFKFGTHKEIYEAYIEQTGFKL